MQYWMPEAEIFVKPATMGLDILMVGADINFKVEAKLTSKIEDDNDTS